MTALWIILGILAAYIIISIPIYFLMKYLYEKKKVKVLPNVKYKWLWYLIHFTWSLPMTLFGCVVALILVCRGYRPKKFGWCWCFELDTGWGMEMGIFFIGKSKSTKKHEHGHAIQNIYLGPFAVTCVSIPSAIRFWTREHIKKKNPGIKLDSYDKAWFEGQATKSGNAFIKQIESK